MCLDLVECTNKVVFKIQPPKSMIYSIKSKIFFKSVGKRKTFLFYNLTITQKEKSTSMGSAFFEILKKKEASYKLKEAPKQSANWLFSFSAGVKGSVL